MIGDVGSVFVIVIPKVGKRTADAAFGGVEVVAANGEVVGGRRLRVGTLTPGPSPVEGEGRYRFRLHPSAFRLVRGTLTPALSPREREIGMAIALWEWVFEHRVEAAEDAGAYVQLDRGVGDAGLLVLAIDDFFAVSAQQAFDVRAEFGRPVRRSRWASGVSCEFCTRTSGEAE